MKERVLYISNMFENFIKYEIYEYCIGLCITNANIYYFGIGCRSSVEITIDMFHYNPISFLYRERLTFYSYIFGN